MPDDPYTGPAVYIQWKNTTVCLDFQCECSPADEMYEMHLDTNGGLYGGMIRCPRCGVCWRLGAPVLERIGPDHADYNPQAPMPEPDDMQPIPVRRGVIGPGNGTQQPVEPDKIEAMVAELVAGAEAYVASQVVDDGRVACRRCGRRCRTYALRDDDGQARLFQHTRLDGDGPCESRGDLY